MLTEGSAFLGAQPRAGPSRPTPRRIYKPRRGLNDTSVLSKSCHGRNLGLGEAVIWRMSVERVGTAQGGSDDPDFKYQKEHEQEWKQKQGRDRVLQIVDSVPENAGLPDFLNRLEEGGHRDELVWHIRLRNCLPRWRSNQMTVPDRCRRIACQS